MKKTQIFSFFLFFFVISVSQAQNLDKKATKFIKSLSPELKKQAVFTMDDAERLNMNYVPLMRKGPTFHEFNEKQKALAIDLLKSSLSEEGFHRAQEIMQLENVLKEIENDGKTMADGRPRRDPLNYHFCIFGDPAGKDLWGWRFEGHHISLNFTSEAGILVSSTPTFYGSNPGKVSTGNQRGKEVLKLEGSLGFELLGSFSQEQLQRVRFSEEAPRDIISANKSEAIVLSPKGISYEEMSEKQQQVFLKLIDLYIVNYEFGFAGRLRNKIDNAGIENFYFAWAGSLVPGQGHYYRIQGPDILIEYDNVQDNANHVHSVVRELSNDFAGDILKRHYEQEHK